MGGTSGRLDLTGLEATARVAGRLATAWRAGDVVTLAGPLGAGKTTFARFLIRAMGVAEEVPSPTFNLVLDYGCPRGEIRHFDLFRLNAPEEAFELGIEEAFDEALVLIEWPERIAELLPRSRLDLVLSSGEGHEDRDLAWHAWGEGGGRLAAALAGEPG